MDLIITIANNTDYTPYLAAVHVVGAQWVPTQELTVQQPIANHSQVVGMLSGDVGFHGDITVRFSFAGRGGRPAHLQHHRTRRARGGGLQRTG